MTRDDVEATIWRTLAHYTPRPDPKHVAQLMDAIDAHTQQVTRNLDRASTRRQVLHKAVTIPKPPPKVHYGRRISACGHAHHVVCTLTLVPADVTCALCKRTSLYRGALGLV